jgi:hypothetical protein
MYLGHPLVHPLAFREGILLPATSVAVFAPDASWAWNAIAGGSPRFLVI